MLKALFARLRYRAPRIHIVRGDITTEMVDVVVNAAKPSLLGGGGVDGAIHRVGGPAILRDCRRVAALLPGEKLPTGEAVLTTAGHLPATFVAHTVGPVWDRNPVAPQRADLLRACYTNSIAAAAGSGARSIAFPLISSGVYGWPVEDAIVQALTAIRATRTPIKLVRLVLFDKPTYDLAVEVAARR